MDAVKCWAVILRSRNDISELLSQICKTEAEAVQWALYWQQHYRNDFQAEIVDFVVPLRGRRVTVQELDAKEPTHEQPPF